jgi:tetratricopeptide (TPR) repeat protein
MNRVEKTVFISYRRATGSIWALAIAQNLTQHGYDVFFDFQGIASGDFEQVILQNIRARAHFLLLLTPSALERIDEPNNWLRREIIIALEERRNIVPIMLEGFDFSTPAIGKHLIGPLSALKAYNGLTVPIEYFDEAMHRLRNRHLNTAVAAVLHPASTVAEGAAIEQREAVDAAPAVRTEELTAERWFERGVDASDVEAKVLYYTEAIRLRNDFVAAYNNRGLARRKKGDLEGALADFSEAIRLDPDFAIAYNNRAFGRQQKGDIEGAMADFDAAVQRSPKRAYVYNNRGMARRDQGDVDGALETSSKRFGCSRSMQTLTTTERKSESNRETSLQLLRIIGTT